jgi:hypothetical protein
MKKLAEILSGPEAWTQGYLLRNGRSCLLGGLYLLGGYLRGSGVSPEVGRLRRVIDERFGGWQPFEKLPAARLQDDELAVIAWNDDPARTWDEVALVVADYDRDRMLNP